MPTKIQRLYHITHRDNVSSILSRGIFSHAAIDDLMKKRNGGILAAMRRFRNGAKEGRFEPNLVYNSEVVALRKNRMVTSDKSLWNYANFYFNARNPMLFTVIRGGEKVVVLEVSPSILQAEGVMVAIGNAARVSQSPILPADEGIKRIANPDVWKKVTAKWWNADDDIKRLCMSEALVPGNVAPEHVISIYAPTQEDKQALEKKLGDLRHPEIVVESDMFFEQKKIWPVTEKIRLVEGDMFLSRMQTLTVSVNTVGVMGKGLASRAKYQFPDAYVAYQDACRKKLIALGKPFVYERRSIDAAWSDLSDTFANDAGEKLLFFPTKGHWRDDSTTDHIIGGMKWLIENREKEGITSIALPALGCGLGNLPWSKVGPLMCKGLWHLGIPAEIYLPNEKNILEEQKQRKFLLGERS